MWGWDPGSGWAWVMGIGMVAFWGLIGLGLWALIRAPHRHSEDRQQPTPEAILAERFARGEISAEEFRERRQVLSTG